MCVTRDKLLDLYKIMGMDMWRLEQSLKSAKTKQEADAINSAIDMVRMYRDTIVEIRKGISDDR